MERFSRKSNQLSQLQQRPVVFFRKIRSKGVQIQIKKEKITYFFAFSENLFKFLNIPYVNKTSSRFMYKLEIKSCFYDMPRITNILKNILFCKIVDKYSKVEKILKGNLDLIHSSFVKFQIMKYTWCIKAKHCSALSTIFLYSKVCWQYLFLLNKLN